MKTPEDKFAELLKTIDDDFIGELLTMEYWDYLHSEYWKTIKDYLICIKGDICEFCGEEAAQVHHGTYKYRNMGLDHEHLENLYLICKDCHKVIHGRSKKDIGEGNTIYLGRININDFWTLFIRDEKESHVRAKYIETKQEDYLKEQRFLNFIISNKHFLGSNIYRQFNPR